MCLNTGKFPSECKKGNVVPIHRKDDKQNVKNYRPVSLLPICGKIFERLIYNFMYDFLTDNNLSPNPSGFRSGASSISQLLSINGDILNAVDKGYLLIFQRLLTRYDMMVLFLNCVKMV